MPMEKQHLQDWTRLALSKESFQIVQVKIDYTWLGKIEKELRSSTYKIKEIHYFDTVEVETFVDESSVQAFMDWMIELTNGQCTLEKGETVYLEEDYVS